MKTTRMLAEIVSVTLATMLCLTPAVSAAQQKNSAVPKTQNVAAQKTKEATHKSWSDGGPHEGIKVHGHWSIVVKNADGSVASHQEFENALIGSGSDMLAQLLARNTSMGGWGISVVPSGAGLSSCGGNLPCVVIEAGEATGVVSVSSNLTVVYSASPSRTTLQGSFQATSAGDIAQVSTLLSACPATLAPSSCPSASNNSGQGVFSSRTLTAPITVQAGQIVQVTVTFTFS